MIRIVLQRRIFQCPQNRIGGEQAWDSLCHCQRWYITVGSSSHGRKNNGSGEHENAAGTTLLSTPAPKNTSSLCQLSNHPDFRLRRKKEELAVHVTTMDKMDMFESVTRLNDGTSSSALVADRLRMARRRAIESMNESFPARIPQKAALLRANKSPHFFANHAGCTILPIIENPIRSNDGTSSGALVADRLRRARKMAIESTMNAQQQQLHAHGATEQPDDGELLVSSVLSHTKDTSPKSILVIENPNRSSDGTSSGALAADRLRMARRKAIESMITHRHYE